MHTIEKNIFGKKNLNGTAIHVPVKKENINIKRNYLKSQSTFKLYSLTN